MLSCCFNLLSCTPIEVALTTSEEVLCFLFAITNEMSKIAPTNKNKIHESYYHYYEVMGISDIDTYENMCLNIRELIWIYVGVIYNERNLYYETNDGIGYKRKNLDIGFIDLEKNIQVT